MPIAPADVFSQCAGKRRSCRSPSAGDRYELRDVDTYQALASIQRAMLLESTE